MEVAVLAEKVNRLGLWLFAAVYFGVTACGLTLAVRASQPRYHYEVRQDLSVHFDNADKVIEKVRSRLKERQKVIRITYSAKNSSLDDTDKLVRELMQFACAETDCPDEGDYIGCQLGGYNSSFTEERSDDGHKNVIEITPIYFTDAAQEIETDDAVREVIESLGLSDDASDEEKVSAVYEWVCDNVQYDHIHRRNDSYRLRSAAYGALVFRRATCMGYAVTVYRLLRELGVGCRVITGDAAGEYHAWNIVCIDGEWYNADATWDSMGGGRANYLKSDSDFGDHVREEKFETAEFRAQYPMAVTSLKGK